MKITEEDIINAGIDFQMSRNPMAIGGAKFDDIVRAYNRNGAFEAGAKWAIEKMEEDCNRLNHTIKCPDCKEVFTWEDEDVVDDIWIICPDCKKRLCILDF